uniref:1-phosphatidylinositol 4-kinase n=1 Tax=Globisporangium ultimum (strain ATCC 200006 / CBS 805.95 / DAOM BR144) TaxID=431595 RepID=K3XAX2_GLOUD
MAVEAQHVPPPLSADVAADTILAAAGDGVGGEKQGDADTVVTTTMKSEHQQAETEDDMKNAAKAVAAHAKMPVQAQSPVKTFIVNEESDESKTFADHEDSDWRTSSSSESPGRFSIIDIPSKVRASLFTRKPRKMRRKKTKSVDTSSPSSSNPTLTSAPSLKSVPSLKKIVVPEEPDKNVEKFKHFWDEKLRNTMEKITSLSKAESGPASFEQQNDVFHLLLKLYAHQDIVEELYSSCETNAAEFEFYIPQLCTFLLHGNYAKQHQLECFLMSRSGESLAFAHRLTWFLRSFCEDAKSYKSEYLSVTASPDQENSDLLTAIEQRAGVPALLMNNGLCNEEVSVARPANLSRRRSSIFAIDEEMDPRVLENDESFAGHLQSKRELVVYEARPEEGSTQQTSLFNQTPDFVSALTDLADRLIGVPLSQRVTQLRAGLSEIQEKVLPSDVLYLPIGNSHHRVKAIHVDECFTFSTKERVPCFLVVEVLDYNSAPPAASPKKKKLEEDVVDRTQPRGFSLKMPFKKTGHVVMDSSQLPPAGNGHTSDLSVSEPATTAKRASVPTDCSVAVPLANEQEQHQDSVDEALQAEPIQEATAMPKSTKPEKESETVATSSSYTPFFLAGLLGAKKSKPKKADMKNLDKGAVPLTPKDPLDGGEEGDDEKEVEEKHVETEDEAEKKANDELEKASEEQKMRMGQWSLPRAGRRKARASAAARSGGQFDNFYSTWFSKKQKREKEEACIDPDSAISAVESKEEPTSEAAAEVSVSMEPVIPIVTPAPAVVDKKAKRKGKAKLKFDLEDGLTDNERDNTDSEDEGKISTITEETAKDEEEETPVIVFRERWSEKEARIRKTSAFRDHPGWRLLSVIVKSNDDLRQEQFAAQLIAQCDRIFKEYSLPLRLRPYNVIATSAKTGLIEAVPDTVSLDSLKRNDPDYTTLLDFFYRLHGNKDSVAFARARRNFVESLAAYSMVCYVFQIKDRHNGNILLDTQGHVIHIDFGFLLTNSPGSNLNFERAPFKLTDEFVELMGGPRSSTFRYFRSLCIRAFLALQRNMEKIVLLVEMMFVGNADLPCFAGGKRTVIEGLRARLKPGERTSTCQVFVNQLIDQSINNWRTRWYDKYQRAWVGIM